MRLGEKIRYLREVEGALRGLSREMTQQEVVRAVKKELRKTISQSYLSQIESGARPHLTNSTRLLLAKFFKVHPGYLVSDPPGFQTDLSPDLTPVEGVLDRWLLEGAVLLAHDQPLSVALERIAGHPDSRACMLLLGEMLSMPGLVDRLSDTLMPKVRT